MAPLSLETLHGQVLPLSELLKKGYHHRCRLFAESYGFASSPLGHENVFWVFHLSFRRSCANRRPMKAVTMKIQMR
jgi:hypothetical protein